MRYHDQGGWCASRTPGSLTLGAVGSARLPLFGKLLIDFLPVKEVAGIQPPHVAFILWLNCVIANTHDVEIASADFDREIAKTLSGDDEGAAWLVFYPGLLLTCSAAYSAVLPKP